MSANVYIDGFNLYYGCVKGTPHRWLDLEAFCEQLLPSESINKIRYFTARVSARPGDPGGPQRQDTYLRALATLPKVSVHFGNFKTRPTWLQLVTPPLIGAKKAHVLKTEEKGSDVNLASHALLDGFHGDYDTAVIVSNDSDLCEPVAMIRYDLGLRVGIINPHPRKKRSRELSQHANFVKEVGPAALACQFAPTLTDSVGAFHKPKKW